MQNKGRFAYGYPPVNRPPDRRERQLDDGRSAFGASCHLCWCLCRPSFAGATVPPAITNFLLSCCRAATTLRPVAVKEARDARDHKKIVEGIGTLAARKSATSAPTLEQRHQTPTLCSLSSHTRQATRESKQAVDSGSLAELHIPQPTQLIDRLGAAKGKVARAKCQTDLERKLTTAQSTGTCAQDSPGQLNYSTL